MYVNIISLLLDAGGMRVYFSFWSGMAHSLYFPKLLADTTYDGASGGTSQKGNLYEFGF